MNSLVDAQEWNASTAEGKAVGEPAHIRNVLAELGHEHR